MEVGRAGNNGTTTITAATITIRMKTDGVNATGVIGKGATNGTADGTKTKIEKTLSKTRAVTPGETKDHNGRNHSNSSQTKVALKERAREREHCSRMTRPNRKKFTL